MQHKLEEYEKDMWSTTKKVETVTLAKPRPVYAGDLLDIDAGNKQSLSLSKALLIILL